jgi:glycosyltransferase involved in cell wall biosynthesis
MAARVPVITVAYSGLADFVSEETAFTIPHHLEPAETHFHVPNSLWAEPDGDRLAEEMRRMAEHPGREETVQRVTAARDLITTKFSWNAVTRRFDEFIADLEDAAQVPRVAMVTSWNSRCGVAENSRNIVSHSADTVSYEIFADKDSEIVDPDLEFGVVRNWVSRWSPELGELDDALKLADPDVVHLQFNFGFFELERLGGLINRQSEDRAVVVTFHRTRDIDIEGSHVSLSDIRAALERVQRLIVHQEADARVLAGFGLTDKVSVVPIGCAEPPAVSPSEARKAMGLGDRPIVATFGFLLPHKGVLELIRVIDSLRSEIPDICLLALCARHPDDSSRVYEEIVRKEIEERGLAQNVVLVTDYLPEETSRSILRSADAIVLAYKETEESSSAAIRFVLPLERPVIATDLAIFADCREALLTVDPEDPYALEDALRRVLGDDQLASDLAMRSRRAARRLRWSRIAAEHRQIYAAARRSFAQSLYGDRRAAR